MTTLLLTGFEPFGGDAENASLAVVRAIEDRWAERARQTDQGDAGVTLVTGVLPVAYGAADRRLRELLDEHRPDLVVAVGEAGGRPLVTPEALARNVDDARIPDNDGEQPRKRPIDPEGEDLPARMAVDAIVAEGAATGLPLAVSRDAGAFLCNHVFYRLMQWTDVPGGFVHVPAWRSRGTATVGSETDASARPAKDTPELDELVGSVEFVLAKLVDAS